MSTRSSVLIACGGTGGHLFPGIAVAQSLRERGVHTLLAISEKAVDRTAAQGYGDLEFLPLPARPMPKPWSPAVFPFLAGSWKALARSRVAMAANATGAVLGMGGFTAMMPVLAARLGGLPVFLHDSNAIPGKTTKAAARFANTVFLGLAEAASHFGKTRTKVVGTPVRREFHTPPDRAEAARHFDLDPAKKTLLVLGGSQGARALNRSAVEALAGFDPSIVQAILLTGATDNEGTLAHLRDRGLPHTVRVLSFCRDMPAAYACADAAVARAGASTLAELAMVGLPAVLVPYPHAAEDHQTANANAYVSAGAAELLPESRITGPALAAVLRQWWSDETLLRRMSHAMRGLAYPHAAESMAAEILASLA
jgi:UDP-N-acetylglucosamine--N-acetylmuramyl-(pentapeptide) pyrophosphoryl-undecaprenol N-acetylglucosamine transferase